MYLYKSVKKKSFWVKKKILSWFQRCTSKGEIWHSSMSWWHICAKQALHRILFHIMCFINCTPVIKPTVSWEEDSDSKLPKVSFHFLCSLSTVNKNWLTMRIWDCHFRDSRLRSFIIAREPAFVKLVRWRGKIWGADGRQICVRICFSARAS